MGKASTAQAAAVLGFSGAQASDNPSANPLSESLGFSPPSPGARPQSLDMRRPSQGRPIDSGDFSDLDEAFRLALADSTDLGHPQAAGANMWPAGSVPLAESGPVPGHTPTRAYSDVADAGALLGALYEHGPKSSPAQDRFPEPSSSPDVPPARATSASSGPPVVSDRAPTVDHRVPNGPGAGSGQEQSGATSSPMSSMLAFPAPGQPAKSVSGTGDAGDIPGLLAAAGDDPFADIDVRGPASNGANSPPESPVSYFSSGSNGLMSSSIDLSRPEGPSGSIDLGPPAPPASLERRRADSSLLPDAEPLARMELARIAPTFNERDAGEETAVVGAYAASLAEQPKPSDSRWPFLAGVLLGLMALVFVWPDLGQRAVESFLPSDWEVEWVSPVAPPAPIEASRAKVTTYPTKNGDVLVIAGDARNRTDKMLHGVRISVSVFDEAGAQVDERSNLVDVVLTEGQLTEVTDEAALDAASREAELAHGARGVALPAGLARPFMVVFPEVPENAENLRYEVSFVVPAQ
ncbi:MAG: hypothetical protein AAFN74_00650 [Myxococcota bacterium]